MFLSFYVLCKIIKVALRNYSAYDVTSGTHYCFIKCSPGMNETKIGQI